MKNVFDFFDAIYCINLKERTDRWQHAQTVFKDLNIIDRVIRYDAVKFTKEQYPDVFNAPHTRGRAGCTESFLNIIEIAKINSYKNVLIFEDDIELFKDKTFVIDILTKSIVQLHNLNWDLFYLSGNPYGDFESVEVISDHLCRIKTNYTAHAVAFNESIYNSILEERLNCKTIVNYIDKHQIFDAYLNANILPRNNSYMPRNLLFSQTEGFSNISDQHQKNILCIEKHYSDNPYLYV
jgi:hypothetical protein